ncbi:SpoIIE family protein phosphatase [Gaiella sp.]|uniref:SpoIIE family protein phosphatase n=1 Tax=Gaiella sp. TaxID=2663207 RepID=UPI003267FB7C
MELGDDADLTEAGDFRPRARSAVTAMSVGVIIGAVGVLGATLVFALSGNVVYAPLIGAAAVAVWTAGTTGAVAAVVTGWALAAWALTPPRFVLDIATRDAFDRWAVSLVVGVIVVGVGVAMRRGQSRAADAVDRAERSRLQVLGLQGLSASLSAALTPEEVARALVDGVPAAIGARGGAFGLVEGDELVIVDPSGSAKQTLQPGARMPLKTRAPITTAAREATPAWAQRRREFVSRFPDGAALAPYASGALAVPVLIGERLVGAMGFPFAEPDAITEEIRTVAQVAADLGGQALERAEFYAQERTSREALDRILAVAPRFLQGATTEAVIESVCEEARRTFGCDVAQVWKPLGGDEEVEVAWRDPPSPVIPPGTRIAYADLPGLIEEMHALRALFVENALSHARGEALRHARELGIFSSLRIPIAIGSQFDRVLVLQWERVIAEPPPSILAVARRFADQAGLAIEQAERRRAQEQTRALQAVTEAFAVAATPADVGTAVVRQGVVALGARAATVYALSEDGRSVELVASEGYADEVMTTWSTLDVDAEAPVTDAIRTGEMVVCRSPEEIAARYPWFDATEDSFVAAPLIAAGRAIGAVFIGSLGKRKDTLADLSLVVSLARQAAQALDRAQLFEREHLSANRLRKLQLVTAALSKAVTAADVSHACLEHAAAGIGAAEGLVGLPRKGSSLFSLDVVAAIGALQSMDEIPAGAAGPIAECLSGGQLVAAADGWIALPLANGALALRSPSVRPIATADRDWLTTLVSQGAQALDRAGRYETERSIAETLQRSVLPERLPSLYGVKFAARYLPGTVGVDVGGDWYDVIHLSDGRMGLVIGDVVGKGVRAAAMMGQLRNALRAFAFEHTDPYEVVSRLGKFVDGMVEVPFATLVYLVVDPRRRGARYVVAGHPPPLVRASDGTTTFLDGGRTLPIGVDASLGFAAGDVEFEPGSTVVLYTDGLVERRGMPLEEGLQLLAASATVSIDDPELLADDVIAALTGGHERPDDVAVLVARFATVVGEEFGSVRPATTEGLIEMRGAFRAWLAAGCVEQSAAADLDLATWEACVNAIEHAQDPAEQTFALRAVLDDGGWLHIEVEDSGRWKEGALSVDRGLGLTLIRSLMDTVEVRTSDTGTTIVIEHLVSAEPKV